MSPSLPERPVVLSVEQALSLPYATLRMVHQGWRVIRLETPPRPGQARGGDPNRYVGKPVAPPDRHAYFIGPNVGKEAICIDLKRPEGRRLLGRLLDTLPVDVFCTNTLPAHHERLGIDPATLRAGRPHLTWCGISALGRAHPDVPGYDPVLQALCGYMDLTGERDGPPLQVGLPVVDLKAGDEAFTQVVLSLLDRARHGEGRLVDVSMAHSAASWLQTFLPLLDMGTKPAELQRNGNEHRQFFPVDAYPCSDGFVYVAVGSDAQWQRLTRQPLFSALVEERFESNEGRREHRGELRRRMREATGAVGVEPLVAALRAAGIPHAPITPVAEVADLEFLRDALLHTRTPDGAEVRLPPAAVPGDSLKERRGHLPFAPGYGAHTDGVLAEVGLSDKQIATLRQEGVIA